MTALAPHHAEILTAAAIGLDVASEADVRTVAALDELPEALRWCRSVPGLLFPMAGAVNASVQYRPDTPTADTDGRARKYLFPAGSTPVVAIHPRMRDRVLHGRETLVIVEGTKQHLAAVTAAGREHAVVGVAGCWGWSTDGAPVPDLVAIPLGGRDVVVIFDADVSTNRNVYDAADRLAGELAVLGAGSVRFAKLPGGGKQGLDDVLAARPVDGSTSGPFARIVERADKLGKRPARSEYTGPNGPAIEKIVAELRRRLTLAVDPGERLLSYDRGVYVDGRHLVRSALVDMLADDYRAQTAATVEQVLVSTIIASGRVVRDDASGGLVNLRNGLLDPATGRLEPHSPDHLSVVQFPIDWNPDARCPNFDAWLSEAAAGRGDDLLEAASLVLDTAGQRQRAAILLYGPTRSGKSTFIRVLERLVGDNRSAVTLHDLARTRFAAADLFGKVLNAAAELSDAHIDDVALFKALTGDDPVRAERKYGQPFTFRNRALFVFGGNAIPTVGEASGAYLARLRLYEFPHSFEGREDPTLEAAIAAEMEGVLVRLVEAFRRLVDRGGYVNDAAAQAARSDLARRSDRVALFLHEATRSDPGGWASRAELAAAFTRWVELNRRQNLSSHKFYEHIKAAGYAPCKRRGERGFGGVKVLPECDWGADDDEEEEAPTGGQKRSSKVPPACPPPAPQTPETAPEASETAPETSETAPETSETALGGTWGAGRGQVGGRFVSDETEVNPLVGEPQISRGADRTGFDNNPLYRKSREGEKGLERLLREPVLSAPQADSVPLADVAEIVEEVW